MQGRTHHGNVSVCRGLFLPALSLIVRCASFLPGNNLQGGLKGFAKLTKLKTLLLGCVAWEYAGAAKVFSSIKHCTFATIPMLSNSKVSFTVLEPLLKR